MLRSQWTYLAGRPPSLEAREGGEGGAGGAAERAAELPSLDVARLRRPPSCFRVRGVTGLDAPAAIKWIKHNGSGILGLDGWDQVRAFPEFVSGRSGCQSWRSIKALGARLPLPLRRFVSATRQRGPLLVCAACLLRPCSAPSDPGSPKLNTAHPSQCVAAHQCLEARVPAEAGRRPAQRPPGPAAGAPARRSRRPCR